MSELLEDLAFTEANDVRVTVVTNASPVCLVRLVHEASGTAVECTGKGQIGVRHEAVEEMRRRLARAPAPSAVTLVWHGGNGGPPPVIGERIVSMLRGVPIT